VRITIDNLDGLGAVDYTGTVAAEGPITLQRALNEPSRCTAEIVLGLDGLAVPARRGRVVVTAQDATLLFTGYLATEPVRVWAGEASEGAVYRASPPSAMSGCWTTSARAPDCATRRCSASMAVRWWQGSPRARRPPVERASR
jgi:hypothetical protein